MPEDRIILIDKPIKWTSFDVVKKVRNQLNLKKVGHAGTLDPLATGLLILCTGRTTKKIACFQEQEKEYVGTMVIGKTTPSYDGETTPSAEVDTAHITPAMVLATAEQFVGKSQQIPPAYSAIKIQGQRAYKLARAGQQPLLKAREINITHFEVTTDHLPELHFHVVCSKGTYIRSLVKDFGEALNVGSYLTALRRIRIGKFLLEDAVSPDQLR